MSGTTVLTKARLADGRLVDISIDDGTVSAIAPNGTADGNDRPSTGQNRGRHRDLRGHIVLPGFREPHAHLDKALSAETVDNPAGDLGGAITAWLDYRAGISHRNYVERATAAVDIYRRHGVREIRTHVDLGLDVGTKGLEALLEVKAAVADDVDLNLVGLPVGLTGDNASAVVAVCRRALDLGLDLMGGVPHIEEDPVQAIEIILELAGGYGRGVDIHADENLNPASGDLLSLSQAVKRTGFEPPATASHCVALSVKPLDEQKRIARLAAEAGVSVVALPHTNLYLQARDQQVSPPRGLTPVHLLTHAGVTVAAGGDNLQDPFNPLGSGDPLEVASLMVLAGHLTVLDAVSAITTTGRAVVSEGDLGDLVAIPGESIREVVATRPAQRLLLDSW